MSCDHDMALGTCPECDDFKNWPGLVSEADPPGTSSMSDHGPNFNPPRSETVSPRTGPVGTLDRAEIRDRMKAHGQLSVATSDGVIEVKVTVTKRDSAEGRATARGCGCVCRECLRADGATHQVCIHRCGLARRAAVPASGDAQGVSLTNRQIAERLGDMVKGAEAWLPRHENALVRMLEEQRSEAAPTGPDNLTSVESHCATCARCQTYRKMADDEARRLGAELAKLRAEKNDRHQKAFEAVRGSADAQLRTTECGRAADAPEPLVDALLIAVRRLLAKREGNEHPRAPQTAWVEVIDALNAYQRSLNEAMDRRERDQISGAENALRGSFGAPGCSPGQSTGARVVVDSTTPAGGPEEAGVSLRNARVEPECTCSDPAVPKLPDHHSSSCAWAVWARATHSSGLEGSPLSLLDEATLRMELGALRRVYEAAQAAPNRDCHCKQPTCMALNEALDAASPFTREADK